MILQQINNCLRAFNFDDCELDDDIYYMRGDLQGYSICVENREHEYKVIAGKRTETAPHYIVLREFTEYNYPHEPDYTDTEEVSEHLTIAAAVIDILHRHLDDRAELYFESLQDYEAEQYYASII